MTRKNTFKSVIELSDKKFQCEVYYEYEPNDITKTLTITDVVLLDNNDYDYGAFDWMPDSASDALQEEALQHGIEWENEMCEELKDN